MRHHSRSASGSSASSRRCASAISSADRRARHRARQGEAQQPPVAAAYDRWAATYDTDRNATRDLDAAVVRATDLPLRGANVLELGCGTGKNTRWLSQHARHVTALDLSAGMLERARQRVDATNAAFIRADLRDPWPIADASVDVVVANLVLEHVEHLEPVLTAAARALRIGGEAFFCELHPYRQWQGAQAQFTDPASGQTVRVAAYSHSVSEYVNAAIAAGFAVHRLGEWVEPDAPAGSLPRLLSLRLR